MRAILEFRRVCLPLIFATKNVRMLREIGACFRRLVLTKLKASEFRNLHSYSLHLRGAQEDQAIPADQAVYLFQL